MEVCTVTAYLHINFAHKLNLKRQNLMSKRKLVWYVFSLVVFILIAVDIVKNLYAALCN